jgi:hypothetical protein
VEIVAEAEKKRRTRRYKSMPTSKLAPRLVPGLERYKKRCNPDGLSEFARQMREFAESLERPGKNKEKARP